MLTVLTILTNKIIKTFLIEDFFHLHLSCEYLDDGIPSGLGKLIHEKNLKSKIS